MTPFRLAAAVAVGLLALPALSGTGEALVTEDNFVSKTTGDLAALCGAAPTDRLYTAAINFCHGFGSGAYGALATVQRVNPRMKRFCVPDHVTRNEAIASFIAWTGANPRRAALPVLDGIIAFLIDSYPCGKAKSGQTTGRPT